MITSMLPMFSFLLGFIMASSPSPDRKHGLYRQPSRFGCERSRFRSPAGPVFCIGPHHPKPDQPRPLLRGGARRVLLPVRRVPPTARVGCYYVGGFAARCSCFGASLSSCAVCGSSVRTLGVGLHAASVWWAIFSIWC
ncbi:hypothetical protein PF003_g41052 [Phytophthora fragariae]|nr:hypothetical protein PF003_g41052 [Phytophthora fragariae]